MRYYTILVALSLVLLASCEISSTILYNTLNEHRTPERIHNDSICDVIYDALMITERMFGLEGHCGDESFLWTYNYPDMLLYYGHLDRSIVDLYLGKDTLHIVHIDFPRPTYDTVIKYGAIPFARIDSLVIESVNFKGTDGHNWRFYTDSITPDMEYLKSFEW